MLRVPLALTMMALIACRSRPTPSASSEVDRLVSSALEKMKQGELDQALADLDRAVELAPRSAEAHRQRAHCRVLFGDHPSALADLEIALALEPSDPWSHYARGVSSWETGDPTGAIESFTRALTLDPGHYKSAQHRAHVHIVRGDHERALADLELAVRITPAGDADVGWIEDALARTRAVLLERSP